MGFFDVPKSDEQMNIKSITVSDMVKKFHRIYVQTNYTIHNA